jgi:hypothetical protein
MKSCRLCGRSVKGLVCACSLCELKICDKTKEGLFDSH